MAINERLIHTAAEEAAAGTGNQEEGLILHLDANDVDSYDEDGSVWYDITNHEYTPAEDPSDHFNTVLYTGNGSASGQSITGVGFQPDLVWVKKRNTSARHQIQDSINGDGWFDSSDTFSYQPSNFPVETFDSDGFTIPSNYTYTNNNNDTYVAWCFKAGGAPSGSDKVSIDGTSYSTMTAAGLTDGTEAIDKLSVNTKLGFSIVKYTAPALRVDTVAHGLGETPEMIILKSRSVSRNWNVFHKDVGISKNLHLNTTDLANTSEDWTVNSTTFSIQDYSASADWAAYCFTSKRGVSKVGSYKGTSASGNKVYTGFQPAFVMMKKTSASGASWLMVDNKRKESNDNLSELFADTLTAESGSGYDIDFNADGFTLNTTTGNANTDGATYIYLAFAAEKPDSLTPIRADFEEGTATSGFEIELDANDYSGSGNWLDNTSNDNDASLTNTTYVNDGSSDYLDFNGSSSHATISHSADLNSKIGMTVEVWCKFDSVPASGAAGVVSKRNTSGTQPNWVIGTFNGNWQFSVDNNIHCAPSIAPEANKWLHVVGTYDGTNAILYVNGEAIKTTAATATPNVSTAPVSLGRWYSDHNSYRFDGQIAIFRFYKTGLTGSEVEANYDATKGLYQYVNLELNLAASTHANPTIGTVTSGAELEFDANDYSGSGNWLNTGAASSSDGTVTGATYNNNEKSDYFSFGGSDYITSSSSGLTANTYTIEAWFYISTLKTAGIVSWGDAGSNYERRSMITWNGGGSTYYLYSSSYASNIRGNTALEAGKWYHGAVTMDNGSAKIYLNGALDGSGTNTLSAYTSSTLYVGRTAEASEIFNGDIAISRVYDTVLTAEQIEANYNAHKEQYTFRLTDSTSNANHPVTSGDPAFDKELGDFIVFDGTDDELDLTGSTSLTDRTVEMWYRTHDKANNYWIFDSMPQTGPQNSFGVWSIYLDSTYIYGAGSKWNGSTYGAALVSSSAITEGKWHHIVFTCKNSDHRIYVDGVRQTNISHVNYVNNRNVDSVTLSNVNFMGTRSGYTGGAYFAEGDIGQIRIYSDVLTESQIRQNYRFTKNDYPNGFNGTLPTGYSPSFSADSFDFVRGGITSGDQVQFNSNFHAALTNTVEGTVTAWINVDVINGRHTIFGTGHTSDNNDWAVFRTTTSRTLQFSISNAGTANGFYTTATANITTGSWIHVAMSVSEAGVGKMYINGVSQAVAYQTGGTTQWFNDVNTNVASIGSFDRGGSGQYYDPFDGKINEVKVYDRVLTDDEISALHTAGR